MQSQGRAVSPGGLHGVKATQRYVADDIVSMLNLFEVEGVLLVAPMATAHRTMPYGQSRV